MGRRTPYLAKTKATKNKGNKYKSTLTDDYTSQDIFTTESNDTQTTYYDYNNKHKSYKDYFTSDVYDSRTFDMYHPKRKGSGESYTFDDYTTSVVSYNKHRKTPKDLIFSVSTDDYIHNSAEKYNNIASFRDHDHSYPKGLRSREKKRLRLMKDYEKSNYRETIDESEQYVDKSRRYRSPRSRYYQDLIHEEPEKEFEYEQYFENAGPKVGSSPKQRKQDKYRDERYEKKNRQQSQFPNDRKNYQVYAYEDPKHHEEVFKGKNHPGDLSLSSEVEIKTHEYPVLAFRDAKSGNKESDMVYLPIIVLDKKSGKSKPDKHSENPIYQPKQENFQIFAANLQEQQNIFQHFGGLPNITTKEPTSTEKEHTLPPDFGIEATSGMRYADSLLGTIINEAVDTDFKDEDLVNETKAGQRIPFPAGRSPFTYQVDVDILSNEPTGSLKDKDKKSSLIKNSSINDPLHDGYPVTKDYIKVSVSEQKRKSSLAPFTSTDKNSLSSVTGQKTSVDKKSNTIKEGTRNSSSIKLIDDQTITMSIAKSKVTPAHKSIMRNPSQDQPLEKEFPSARQSVAKRTTQNSRASHTGPTDKAGSKLSTLNEETSQDLNRKSINTGTAHPQSVVTGKVDSGIAENSTETRHHLQGNDRKSMKPSADGQNPWISPSPGSHDRTSMLHNQNRNSTVAHMTATPTPSSQNIRTSHTQNRKSAEEDRSKEQTPHYSDYDHKKSVLHSQQSHGRKSTVAQKSDPHSMAEQNTRASNAQSRKSSVSPRDDGQKYTKSSALEQSLGKKSLVQSLAQHNTIGVAEKTDKLSHKSDVEDDSAEALAQFTKDVFQLDLEPQEKTPTHKSEQKKHSVSKERPGQSLNVVENVEPSHELIGDSSAGIGKTSTDGEGRKKPSSLMRSTSKMFTTLSKLGKNKSTVQSKPYIPTGSPTGSRKSEGKEKSATTTQGKDDSLFVHSIEPTVTQYKKEQNKTQTLTKSKSDLDTKTPKEKKSLTRLFSRSRSNLRNESGDEKKKSKRSKSRSILGILKRSKSSEVSVAQPTRTPKDEEPYERAVEKDKQAAECECLAHYVQNTRVCVYFFLGTTLHEQIMNIIKMFLSGN